MTKIPFQLVVLISGNGSNLQAIIDAIQNKTLDAKIVLVVSDNAKAFGLERAALADIPCKVLPKSDFKDRESYDKALQQILIETSPDLIVLAGFMRLLSPFLVNYFSGKMINIHPSLLPKYRGLHTHERVLASSDLEHGVSIHFVTEDLDGGPLIEQSSLLIQPKDTPDSLKSRIQTLEHALYPKVIGYFVDKRIKLTPKGVLLDGKCLKNPSDTCRN